MYRIKKINETTVNSANQLLGKRGLTAVYARILQEDLITAQKALHATVGKETNSKLVISGCPRCFSKIATYCEFGKFLRLVSSKHHQISYQMLNQTLNANLH